MPSQPRGPGARQGDLFSGAVPPPAGAPSPELALEARQLRRWQQTLAAFQAPLFRGEPNGEQQGSLFTAASAEPAGDLNPLQLHAQPLSFWRWPETPHQGAALYFVLDSGASGPLLLYVGETGQADRRWKGEHDCKQYLAAYGEALHRAGLSAQLSIRFWLDVPAAVRARRSLEQALIRRWLPPFNKETRQRWATPFTAAGDG